MSTGRGGRGNIRSPSRDAARPLAETISIDSSPARSQERGRGGYDRDLISAIDTANDTGVVSLIDVPPNHIWTLTKFIFT
jgi:hypothetical protein